MSECEKAPEPLYVSYEAFHDDKTFEVRVYFICGVYIAMSNHEGGDCWEDEGAYSFLDFDLFKKDFGIKD